MTWHLMILSKMIRSSSDSYGCSAWRPCSRGEPDKLGWASVCACVCLCTCVHWHVRCFLTRQQQYCSFHSSCRLMGCDICLRRTLPSFLPSPHLSTPYLLFSHFICFPLLYPYLSLFLQCKTQVFHKIIAEHIFYVKSYSVNG